MRGMDYSWGGVWIQGPGLGGTCGEDREAIGSPAGPLLSLLLCLLQAEPPQQLWVNTGTSLGHPWPEGFCGRGRRVGPLLASGFRLCVTLPRDTPQQWPLWEFHITSL